MTTIIGTASRNDCVTCSIHINNNFIHDVMSSKFIILDQVRMCGKHVSYTKIAYQANILEHHNVW